MPQFTTYPYTFTATSAAGDYWHSDGFRLTYGANTFAQNTSITISAPVKKAFFLRSTSTNQYLACAGNYYKLTKNSGADPSLNLTLQVPGKAQFDQDKNDTTFKVYYCTAGVIEEDDPTNWYPTTNKSVPAGTTLVAGQCAAWGFFMLAHSLNGHSQY